MRTLAILTLAIVIAESVIAGYVVDVTFSGDTNDIYSVVVEDGKGMKEFDALLEFAGTEKIGLCEQIVVTEFTVEQQKVSLSIKATSNELSGFTTVDQNGKKKKYPVIRTKQFSLSSLSVFLNAWFPVGGVQQQDGTDIQTMIRVRQEASNKSINSDKE